MPAGDGAVTEAAKAAARSNNPYLSPQYHRLRGRRGPAKATGELSHSMLTGHMLGGQVPYAELGGGDRRRDSNRENCALVRKLEQLGQPVTLDPPTPREPRASTPPDGMFTLLEGASSRLAWRSSSQRRPAGQVADRRRVAAHRQDQRARLGARRGGAGSLRWVRSGLGGWRHRRAGGEEGGVGP
jgi:hypothetical protein